MDANYHLTKCLNLIQERLQWGKASSWTNKDFEVLSEKIHDSTGILISYQTLRRLFGKVQTSISYKPQLETKNALAIFLGFKDWDTFKQSHTCPQPVVTSQNPLPIEEEKNIVLSEAGDLSTTEVENKSRSEVENLSTLKTKKLSRKTFLSIAFISSIALIVTIYFLFIAPAPSVGKVSIKGKNTSGKVPLNVIFNFDISKVPADSIVLDFGTQEKRMVLAKNQHTATLSYLIPGLYQVKLLANNKIIAEETVHAKSEGWTGVLYTDNDFFFLQNNSFIKDGTMRYLPAAKGGIHSDLYKPIKKADVVEFNYFNDFDVDGDNFIFETRLKIVLPDSGNYCNKAYIRIKGEQYPVRAAFVSKGCNTDALLQFGDEFLDGKFHDLELMGQDFTQWQTVRFEVKNKNGKLFLDNKLLYSIPFKKRIGMIKGLTLRLREYGEVDYVKLYNGQNKLVYQEDFSSGRSIQGQQQMQ